MTRLGWRIWGLLETVFWASVYVVAILAALVFFFAGCIDHTGTGFVYWMIAGAILGWLVV